MKYVRDNGDGTVAQIDLRQLAREVAATGVSPVAWWEIEDEAIRHARLAEHNVFPLIEEPRPTYDPRFQFITRLDPAFDAVSGEWRSVWSVTDRAGTVEGVRAEGARRLAAIAAEYTPEERETWATQVNEAKALFADPAAPTPILSALAAADGVPVADMAAVVLAKATGFAMASGAILAAQRTLVAMDPIPSNFMDDAFWPVIP